jgi:regulator of protease activity HflC (stomatin/prohibitin superfamily)
LARLFTSRNRSRDPRLPERGIPINAGVGIVGVLGAIVLLVLAVGILSSFHATAPGEVCVVQEGGPLDGRGVAKVRQAGEGVQNIGIFNKQRCFPATERNYIISSRANEADSKVVDFVEVPTSDAVAVRIEGQALFRLTTDPRQLADFYRRYGVRTFDGEHPYEGDAGWESFLAIQFRPVLDNALREAIGQYRCEQLNNTCQYVQNANQAVTGNVKAIDTGQTLSQAQDAIAKTLQSDLDDTLGGRFFEGIKFRLRGVSFAPEVQSQITRAQATRTAVATARLDAQKRVEQAIGDRLVAEQRARAIRATRNAYADNPAQARIDALKALPPGLQSLGGNTSLLLGGNR